MIRRFFTKRGASIVFTIFLLWNSTPVAPENTQPEPDKAIILCFHDIGGAGLYSITPEEFEQILKLLEKKYEVYSVEGWMNKKEKSDKPSVVLTFDDGYYSIFLHVIPLLKKYGYGGTFYFYLDRYPETSSVYNVLKNLPPQFEIGSHSNSHANMVKEYRNDMTGFFRELYLSKKKLEYLIGREVTSWAWPYGFYDENIAKLAHKAGYTNQVTTDYTASFVTDPIYHRFTVQNPEPVEQVKEILKKNR